jgi:hypothetical protein
MKHFLLGAYLMGLIGAVCLALVLVAVFSTALTYSQPLSQLAPIWIYYQHLSQVALSFLLSRFLVLEVGGWRESLQGVSQPDFRKEAVCPIVYK